MPFNVLSIRTADETDAAMYPTLGRGDAPIAFEAGDGESVTPLTATAVAVNLGTENGLEKVVSAKDLKVSVYITDCRVALGCRKFEKGGGWIGTSLAVPVLNLASHARAALHRHGKCLVGHVRYPWVSAVGFSPKRGWGDVEQVRIALAEKVDGATRRVYLDLTFAKQVDSEAVARAIVRRTAEYRLSHDQELADDERSALTALLDAPRLEPEPKRFAIWSFPTYFFAGEATAFPKGATR